MRRVTFSRNFTLSLSRTCQCYCKYCSFATHKAHLYSPDEVERMLDDAARRGVKELLVLTGEQPEVNPEVAERLRSYGHEDFVSYVAWGLAVTFRSGADTALLYDSLKQVGREDEFQRTNGRVWAIRSTSGAGCSPKSLVTAWRRSRTTARATLAAQHPKSRATQRR